MFLFLRHFGLASVAGCSLVFLAGCGGGTPTQPPVTEHEHAEERPETFSAAVAELKEHAPEIKDAFQAGKPEDADEALHHVAHMLEEMPTLIDGSTLTAEQKTEAKDVSERLFDDYDKLHAVSHPGGETTEVKYEDLASSIDDGLAKLEALAPSEDAPAQEPAADGRDSALSAG